MPPTTTTQRSDALAETIPSAVTASIAARPDAEAVVEPERRVTYGELGELVDASTRAMMAAGVERGDRVAIWAPNGLGWIVTALGAQSAGAAVVPINTRFKGEEAAYVLSASKAATLVTTVGFLGTDTVGMLRAAETPVPHLRRIVLLEGSTSTTEAPKGADVEHWHTFAARGEGITSRRRVGASAERAADGHQRRPVHVRHHRPSQGRGHDPRPDGPAVPRLVRVRRAPARRPLPDRQPVLPHVRLQGRVAREPAPGRHDRSGPGVRRSHRTVPGGDGAHHGAARRPDDLPLDPRPSRARSVRSPARCGWRSPGRPTFRSR